jgi:hypothetical protein
MGKAKVRLSGVGSAGTATATGESFSVDIGNRRMDDGDLVGRKLQRERLRQTLKELGED